MDEQAGLERLAAAVEHLVDVGITIVDAVRELIEAVQASTDITECGYDDDLE